MGALMNCCLVSGANYASMRIYLAVAASSSYSAISVLERFIRLLLDTPSVYLCSMSGSLSCISLSFTNLSCSESSSSLAAAATSVTQLLF